MHCGDNMRMCAIGSMCALLVVCVCLLCVHWELCVSTVRVHVGV